MAARTLSVVGMTFKLNADLSARIATLETDLRGAAQEFRDAFEERSERWREGDAGTSADTWIESLESLADDLERVTDKPE